MANSKEKIELISLFSGAGFLDLGFEMSGFQPKFVNEYYEPFLESYKFARENIGVSDEGVEYSPDDIRKLSEEENSILDKTIQRVDDKSEHWGIIGGPPCPDFSVGGKNKGKHGEKGMLTSVYFDILKEHEPPFFLFENVKGLWSTEKHRKFYESQKTKVENNYFFFEKLINSLEYGVPQDRNRILLVGFHKSIFSKQNFDWNNDKKPKDKIKNLSWPKEQEFQPNSQRSKPKNIPKNLTVQFWFDRNNVSEHPNQKHHFNPKSDKFKKIPEGDTSRKSFKRLHRWRYSPTAAYGNNEVHLHPYKPRRLTAAESLAIQSLPKEYSFPDKMTLTDMFKAIGNGVPFLAAKGLANGIKSYIKKHE